MADVTVTGADVIASANAIKVSAIAGAGVTPGQPVYRGTDYLAYPADANGASATIRTVWGIALNEAGVGQPVQITTEDIALDCGFTATSGAVYVLSATPGGIAPVADVASGDYPTVLGIGNADGTLKFKPVGPGGVVA